MMGATHRSSGAVVSLATYGCLKYWGMLDTGLNNITELVMIYAAGFYGSMFSDNDHHWGSSPLRDPLSHLINWVLHLTRGIRRKMADNGRVGRVYDVLGVLDARHRSWQTHSELTLLFFGWLLLVVPRGVEWTLLVGFSVGLVSHALMDCLSVDGWVFAVGRFVNWVFGKKILPVKIRFVPKSHFFATGGSFEKGFAKFLGVFSILSALGVVAWEIWDIVKVIK